MKIKHKIKYTLKWSIMSHMLMSYKRKDKVNVINDINSVTSSVWKKSISFSNHSIRPNTRGGGYYECTEVRRVPSR